MLDEKIYLEYIEILKEKILFLGVKFIEVFNVRKVELYLILYFDIMFIEVFFLKLKDLVILILVNFLYYIDEL